MEDSEMRSNPGWLRWISVCLFALTAMAGVSAALPVGDDAEAKVRAKFKDMQAAVKSRDPEKIWALLNDKSKTTAEKFVKDVQAAHAKAGAKDKTEMEDALGLKGEEIAKLTAMGYLKTKRFQKKYEEMPDSKVEKVVVQGDNATVHFLEPDGDKEKLIFVRQDGQWNAWLGIPKIKLP
jgi:hypothetical protein